MQLIFEITLHFCFICHIPIGLWNLLLLVDDDDDDGADDNADDDDDDVDVADVDFELWKPPNESESETLMLILKTSQC